MNLLRLAPVAGLATLILTGCGADTLNVTPAAATAPAPSTASAAGTSCDAGRWTGALNPEGRPDAFDAGDVGAVYIWHDPDGWHIRATDQHRTDHHYTGTVRLMPKGSFAGIRPVRDENDDRVWITADNTLHYDFHTFASIDGADFHVACSADPRGGRERQRLGFRTEFDGHPVADRVRIGATRQSPRSADFAFVRSA